MKEQNSQNQAVTETMDGNLVMLREPIMGKDGKQMVTKDGRCGAWLCIEVVQRR